MSSCAPPARHRARGFTLIEMLVIVAVTGILAAISISALHLLIPRWRLQEAGNQLDTLIKRSRLIAIKRQTTIVIGFEDDNDTPVTQASMDRFTVYNLVARGPVVPPAVLGEVIASAPVYSLSSGVDVDAITFPGEVITFDPLGQVGATGEVVFGYPTDPPRRRVLSVAITTLNGATSMEESAT